MNDAIEKYLKLKKKRKVEDCVNACVCVCVRVHK